MTKRTSIPQPGTSMRISEALSTETAWQAAVEQVAAAVTSDLPERIHAAVVFFTPHHLGDAPRIAKRLVELLGTEALIGCSAGQVLGNGHDRGPGLALWAAHLPATRVVPMHLQYEKQTDGGSFVGWPAELLGDRSREGLLLAVGDPYTFPSDAFIDRLNRAQPGMPVVGGMASVGIEAGVNRVVAGTRVEPAGAAGLWLEGGFQARTIVSQGCRPIGDRFVITKAQDNLIQELGGRPPLERLQAMFPKLCPDDQRLVRHGLQLGRVMNEHRSEFGPGDFLIRSVLGLDRDSGGLAIGDLVRIGQTVQFHVRDAAGAGDDLRSMLQEADRRMPGPPAGGLLFTCNGRGRDFFDEPDHDLGCFRGQWENLPVSGFYAAGELGPVGDTNFLHGFTASAALFYPQEAE